VCNGIQDCQGGEDECQNCATSPFSSDKFLISSYVLQVLVWITGKTHFCRDLVMVFDFMHWCFLCLSGLLAVFGNIAVLIHNGFQLKGKEEGRNSISFINRILVLNLATADLLLGVSVISIITNLRLYYLCNIKTCIGLRFSGGNVCQHKADSSVNLKIAMFLQIYLLSLGIVNSAFENIYCRKDIQWRGSAACIGLGCLAMISVEASVFILTIMTTYRYYIFAM